MAIRPSSTGSTASFTTDPDAPKQQYSDTKPSNVGLPLSPRLFALIIGINEYESPEIPNLVGAAPDADAVRYYLQKNLGVPRSQIRNLRNSEATRAAIIDGIEVFSLDDEIKEGDPILIYYAGHGGSADTPKGWKERSTGKIELLVPYDYSSLEGGNPKYGIPDRTLGALLSHLASIKGDNITVILDCCHSGFGRDLRVLDPFFKARAIDVGNIPSDLDQDIWIDFEFPNGSGRGTEFPSGFACKGLRSHVLLAACHPQELAYERTSRGLFTVALLETLVDIGIANLTYATLLGQMPPLSSRQTPQCEGFFRERLLFNGKASDKLTTGVFFKISKSEGESYVIDVGEAAGITMGAEFEVYQDQNSGDLLGIVVARELSAFSTTLYPKEPRTRFALGQDGVALKSRAGTEERLRIHVGDDNLKDLVKKIDPNQVQLVERDQRAEFGMALEDGKVVFNIYDSDVTKHGLTRMPHSLEPTLEVISPVIRGAAHFYWHLRRTPPQTNRGLAKNVEIEVNELEEDFDEELNSFYNPTTTPSGDWKFGKDFNLHTETTYGWTIINKWALPLYPALFFFDASDWSITPYYEPPIAGGTCIIEPPLKAKGHLPVGFGDSGWVSHAFFLREGQNVDVGLLKLFLSRNQVNLSDVAQPSPFVAVHSSSTTPLSPPFGPTGGRCSSTVTSTQSSVLFDDATQAGIDSRSTIQRVTREGPEPTSLGLSWDTVEITVVQRIANK